MWSDQQKYQANIRGSRWRGWFTAWAVDHAYLHDQTYPKPDDLSKVKVIFEDEAGPITKRKWQSDRKDIWFVKNCCCQGVIVDRENKHIWMDAITYLWWMKSLPLPTELPANNWLYLMGSINNRLHRYMLFQRAKQQSWPIIWSAISTDDNDLQAVRAVYKKYRRQWMQQLPLPPYELFPTTYNPDVKFSFTDIDSSDIATQGYWPINRAISETNEQWPDYRLHVCAETLMESNPIQIKQDSCPYITEKTFRAIAHGKPCVWLGSQGTLAYLKKQGYQTYDKFYDESYDNEIDVAKRFQMVCNVLDTINQWSESRWQSVWPHMIKIAEHNHKNLIKHHQESFRNIKETKIIVFSKRQRRAGY